MKNNNIIITVSPINFPGNKCHGLEKKVKQEIAERDLDMARASYLRSLKYDIPVYFATPIHLHLSIDERTMSVKIDYSKIKSSTARRLIKQYLNR